MARDAIPVALITGGAGGLGRAIAARLLARGMHCVLADIDRAALKRAATALGAGVSVWHVDLADAASRAALIEHVTQSLGRIDVLVNNAGMIDTTPFEQRAEASLERELTVNLVAPLLLTRALLPALARAEGGGHVVSIASVGGLFPLPETTTYSAAKFGLRGAMLCLGLDAERLGVRFSTVHPSATETPMLVHEAISGGNRMQFLDPPQRPDEVAAVVVRQLDAPRLERFVRQSESWLVRCVMLMPNALLRVLPWLRSRADAGHQRYLTSLEGRGIIARTPTGWQQTGSV